MRKRLLALFLAVMMLIPCAGMRAHAAEKNVHINSEGNAAFDYLEYRNGDSWYDLNTPRHWITETGEVVYCVEHRLGNPTGTAYTEKAPSSIFKESTIKGLNIIFMNGYPLNLPSGFTEDEARQATANAIRFWLSEQGEENTYNFTNRKARPGYIRAKAGYEHVLTWADELLELARAGKLPVHSIMLSPSQLILKKEGDIFTGEIKVTLNSLNSGYTIDTSALPKGVTVSGFTGKKSETLTVKAETALSGGNFVLKAEGRDTRSTANVTAYAPDSGSTQRLFLAAKEVRTVAEASVSIEAPTFGSLRITKTDEEGKAVSGVTFRVYLDSALKNETGTVTTGADGTAVLPDLPCMTVYVKEVSVPAPFIIDGTVKTAVIEKNKTTAISFTNIRAKGAIEIMKSAPMITGSTKKETEFGVMHVPVFSDAPLMGAVFEITDKDGKKVGTVTTGNDGKAVIHDLPLGTYTVREVSVPEGYVMDTGEKKVTLSYKDEKTPVVKAQLEVRNESLGAYIRVKKETEEFDLGTRSFIRVSGAGFTFGIYTGEDMGGIPKDTLVDLMVTDETGTAVSSVKLPYGKWYIKELSTGRNDVYQIYESLPVAVTGDEEDDINDTYYDDPVFNEMFKGNIAVIKTDSADKSKKLKGAVYRVEDEDGNFMCSMTTDKDGYAVSAPLPVGRYRIRETEPPYGYMADGKTFEAVLSLDSKKTEVIERSDDMNSVTLSKKDLTSGKPVPGAEITVYDEKGNIFFTGMTDEKGEITMDMIPYGKYTFTETAEPDGYSRNTESFSFTVDKYGKIEGDREITDEPLSVVIMKKDGYDGSAMKDIEFYLTDEKEEKVKLRRSDEGWYYVSDDGDETFRTDEEGRAEIRYLKNGRYKLYENIPDGYTGAAVTEIDLTEENGVSEPLSVEAINLMTGLKIVKTDAVSGNPLEEAGFTIKRREGSTYTDLRFTRMDEGYIYDEEGDETELMTGASGEIFIAGLPLGEIWIDETTSPDGYFPVPPVRAEIKNDNTIVEPLLVEIRNMKQVKLGENSDWWETPALLAGIFLAGIAAYVTVKDIRKRKKENEGG